MVRRSFQFTLRYKGLTLFSILIVSHGIVSIGKVIELDLFSTPTLVIISIFLFITWVYLSAGVYPLIWYRFQNVRSDLSQFRSYADNYFLPYLTTSIVLVFFLLFVVILFLIPYCIFSPGAFEGSNPDILFGGFGSLIFSVSTVYCIPLIFMQNLKNLECLKRGLRYLDNWKESSVLWGLILIQYSLTAFLHHFIDRSSPALPAYWFLVVADGVIKGYFLVLIFLTASQILMKEIDKTSLRRSNPS